jgi:CRP-like cAMP-binding protein
MQKSSNIKNNEFLSSLAEADFEALRPHLKPLELVHAAVLFETGGTIARVYFPTSGIVSLVITLENGGTVEAGMIGNDGVVGSSAALDGSLALNKAIVQSSGEALTIDAGRMKDYVRRSETLRTRLYRHDIFMLAQAQQSAACLAKHDVQARLCRWLLRSRDLLQSDNLFLTQEFISEMLGVRRTSVTTVAKQFHTAGMLNYKRGHIELIDIEAIRDSACECYEAVNAQKRMLMRDGPR